MDRRKSLDVCPISLPNINEDNFDFHDCDTLYDMIRIEIAIITAVSKTARDKRQTASKGRWNIAEVRHLPSPIGVTVTSYVKGVLKDSNVHAQRAAKRPTIGRESWYAARTRMKKIQELHGTESATNHSTPLVICPYRQESIGITVMRISSIDIHVGGSN